MRGIKFRAFDKKEKIMCKVSNLNFDLGCFLIGNSPTKDEYFDDRSYIVGQKEGHFVNFEHLELMQFTGLKDKNGVDIYEGDILHFVTSQNKGYPKDDIDVYYTVKFGRNNTTNDTLHASIGFYAEDKNGQENSLEFCIDSKCCKVIGSIYENHELINQ